jgi:hypothetical protein
MAEESDKVTLPGSLFRKKSRWWWKVKLPGESRQKPRSLKPEGSRWGTTDRDEAEEIARAMWQRAIETKARLRAESPAEAGQEVMAAAEAIAEAKAQAAETIARIRTEAAEAITKAEAAYEEKLKAYAETLAETEDKLKAEGQRRAEAEAKLSQLLAGPARSLPCECCGREDVPENELTRIDSGQMLCRDCLRAMRDWPL